MKNSSRAASLLCSSLICFVLNTEAQVFINVGTHGLLPDTPDQPVSLTVSGVQAVAGLDFYVQIGDGFPNVPGSSTDGPNITSVDIVTGTLFAGNNDGGQFGTGLGLQQQYRGVLTLSGTVSGSGLLATLEIDTTGFASGTWALNVENVFNGPTTFYNSNFDPILANITDGFITIVPEPAGYGSLMGVFALGIAASLRAMQGRRCRKFK